MDAFASHSMNDSLKRNQFCESSKVQSAYEIDNFRSLRDPQREYLMFLSKVVHISVEPCIGRQVKIPAANTSPQLKGRVTKNTLL